MFLVRFCSRRTAYIVRDNAKKFTSVGLSYKDVILFSKIFYVIDVVYVKLNSISCEVLNLNNSLNIKIRKSSKDFLVPCNIITHQLQ